jgi:hypothetical protein
MHRRFIVKVEGKARRKRNIIHKAGKPAGAVVTVQTQNNTTENSAVSAGAMRYSSR